MDDMTSPETVSNALQARRFESWQEHECRKAIAAAEAVDGKARVRVSTLKSLLEDHAKVRA